MAYATTNPPRMLIPGVGGGASIWLYDDADAATLVRVADYITDALNLGMKKGDLVIQVDTAGAAVFHIYGVVSVAASGADLTDGQAVDATNTD